VSNLALINHMPSIRPKRSARYTRLQICFSRWPQSPVQNGRPPIDLSPSSQILPKHRRSIGLVPARIPNLQHLKWWRRQGFRPPTLLQFSSVFRSQPATAPLPRMPTLFLSSHPLDLTP